MWCAAGLLLGYVGLLLGNIWLHSGTLYEGMHLASGMAAWRTGRLDAYRVNPPLVRLLASLPAVLAFSERELPLKENPADLRSELSLGEQFYNHAGRDAHRLIVWGRLACLPFGVLGAVACWRWARAMAGEAAGLAALALWCVSPGVLTYAAVTTTDGPAAACTVLAGWAYYAWLVHGEAHRAFWAGLALGAACLTKFTCLVLVPVFACLWILHVWQQRRAKPNDESRPSLAQLGLLFGVALIAVNTAYGFEGTFRPLGRYAFTSLRLGAPRLDTSTVATGNRFADTPLGWVPLPLPALYVEGIDLQWRDMDRPGACYLAGRWLPKGVWYYYVYGLAVKAPLGHWVMGLLAGLCALVRWRGQLKAARLSAPALALAVLVLVSSETNMCTHMRYVLPGAGPFFVWAGASLCGQGRWLKLRCGVAGACLLGSAASVLWYYPHTLAYFNELAGGPLGGPRHLLGSNVDAGQDGWLLERWLAQHREARPFFTNHLFVGRPAEPWARGVEPIPAAPLPEGWYGVSVNAVVAEPPTYPDLRRARLVGRVGYSIYVYYLDPAPERRAVPSTGL
jgi:hypothetical protein